MTLPMMKTLNFTHTNLFQIILASICLFTEIHSKTVVSTWGFSDKAIDSAWNHDAIIDKVQSTAAWCEVNQCDEAVGYGNSPSETGEVFLDAMIMDGKTMNVGAVVGLRRVRDAVAVARAVLDRTAHSILSGESATDFAVQMGFSEESLETVKSNKTHDDWKNNDCQPNYWVNVVPDSKTSCGPYSKPKNKIKISENPKPEFITDKNHDTIGVIGVDNGHAVAACSTNGKNHKIAGRVPDSSIPGSGAWAESSVGACSATGDGDVMVRFSPAMLCVERMLMGDGPNEAAEYAIRRIQKYYPGFSGAIIAVSAGKGEEAGAACSGLAYWGRKFVYGVRSDWDVAAELRSVECIGGGDKKASKRDKKTSKRAGWEGWELN